MKAIPCTVLLLLLVLASLYPVLGQTPRPSMAPAVTDPPISFLPLAGLTLIEKDTYRYEAGAVDTIRTPHLDQTFTFKNTTSQPITITRLRGSCGCETLLLLKGSAPIPTARLYPGEQATIHLGVNLHGGQTGLVRKYVWIDGPEAASQQESPLATLEVDILLLQSVSFEPSFLDFGKVEAGAGASQSLTVSFDADLLSGIEPPRLTSSSPDVQAKPAGPLLRITEGGKSRLRQAYHVTFSPAAHAGRIAGDLAFDLPPVPGGFAPASRVKLLLSGEVAGAIDALPASVFFGSLPSGKSVTRSVVLSTASAASPQSLRATSSAPWLRATLDQTLAPARHRLLSVTLTDQAPVGPIQGRVTIAFGQGEHLDIPVIAELTK